MSYQINTKQLLMKMGYQHQIIIMDVCILIVINSSIGTSESQVNFVILYGKSQIIQSTDLLGNCFICSIHSLLYNYYITVS